MDRCLIIIVTPAPAEPCICMLGINPLDKQLLYLHCCSFHTCCLDIGVRTFLWVQASPFQLRFGSSFLPFFL